MSNTDTSNLIIGISWKASTYRKKLIPMMEELELIDIFRKQYPQKLSFSYESKTLKFCSRIDFFLVARSFSKCVVNIHT